MKILPMTAVAALLVLAACNSKPASPEVLDSNPDPMANTLTNAAPVELPPAIKSEKTLRCKDNSLVYIDWLTDGSARAKTEKTAVGTPVVVGAEGTPSLKGAATDTSITYNGQSCKA